MDKAAVFRQIKAELAAEIGISGAVDRVTP